MDSYTLNRKLFLDNITLLSLILNPNFFQISHLTSDRDTNFNSLITKLYLKFKFNRNTVNNKATIVDVHVIPTI